MRGGGLFKRKKTEIASGRYSQGFYQTEGYESGRGLGKRPRCQGQNEIRKKKNRIGKRKRRSFTYLKTELNLNKKKNDKRGKERSQMNT